MNTPPLRTVAFTYDGDDYEARYREDGDSIADLDVLSDGAVIDASELLHNAAANAIARAQDEERAYWRTGW